MLSLALSRSRSPVLLFLFVVFRLIVAFHSQLKVLPRWCRRSQPFPARPHSRTRSLTDALGLRQAQMSDEDELDALQALVRERMEHLQHDLNLFIGLRAGPGTKERKGLIKKKKKLPSPAEWDRAHWGLILQAAESLFPGVFAAASPRTDAAAGSARGRAGSGSPTVARGKSANPEANAAVGQFEKKFSGWALVDGFRIIVEQLQNLKRDLQQLQQQHVHNRRRQSGDAGTDGLAAEDKPWVPTPPWNQLILGMIGQAAENIFLDSGDEMTSSQRQQQTTPQRKEQAQIQSPRTGQSSDSTAASSPSTSTTRRVTSEEATSPPTRSKGDETLSWSPTLARRASVAHEDHQNVAFSGVSCCVGLLTFLSHHR
eukprot:INCI14325.1.p1 GENE.INCI14325.1~~INCI14325.1.p1  ORF type:complete len:371 (-),score=61.55 INCI14325.1:51-1163(-)